MMGRFGRLGRLSGGLGLLAATPALRAEPDDRYQRARGRQFTGLDERAWRGDWRFIVMADTQLGMLEAKFPDSGESWALELQMAERCVAHVNKLRPKFVVVCGDLVDAAPSPTGTRPLNQRQVASFKQVFSQVDPEIPLVCVCGNHDVGDLPNRRTVQVWRRDFGDDYFGFWCGGCRCVVLNSQLFAAQEHSGWLDGGKFRNVPAEHRCEAEAMAAEQQTWLDNELSRASQEPMAHLLAFSHIPPFIWEADEPKGYFNLEPELRRRLLDQFKAAGCANWFCGHYHYNAVGWDGELEVVTTGAVGTNLPLLVPEGSVESLGLGSRSFTGKQCTEAVSGMRLVNVARDRVTHRWYTVAQLDKLAKQQDGTTIFIDGFDWQKSVG